MAEPLRKLSLAEETLRETAQAWIEAVERCDLEECLSFYSHDAAVLGGHAPVSLGIDEIRRHWRHRMEASVYQLRMDPVSLELAESEDMACQIGHYDLQVRRWEEGAGAVLSRLLHRGVGADHRRRLAHPLGSVQHCGTASRARAGCFPLEPGPIERGGGGPALRRRQRLRRAESLPPIKMGAVPEETGSVAKGGTTHSSHTLPSCARPWNEGIQLSEGCSTQPIAVTVRSKFETS